jgi:hypothetical protein
MTFLQTAQTRAFNLDQPSRQITLHVLLDSGSQCSYITHRASRRLGLRAIGKKSVSIMTFGSRQERLETCNIYRVGLEAVDGSRIELRLLSVSHICEPLLHAAVDLEKYPQFGSLEFSTELARENQIKPEILIGADQYWKLLTGEVMKCNNGRVASNSLLGWILTGPVATERDIENQTIPLTHVLKIDGFVGNNILEKRLNSFWNIE